MIALSGIRYAVGRHTAIVMAVSTAALGVAYSILCSLTVVHWFHELPDSPWSALIGLGQWSMIGAYAGFVVVAFLLAVADKQPVKPRTRALDAPGSWSLELRPVLRSQPAWLPLLMVVLIIALQPLEGGAAIAGEVLITLVAITHLAICVKVTIQMCRDAWTKVNGRTDECRDFNWALFGLNDEMRFRARFVDKRWKYPGLMRHPAEAARYARKAREHRWLSMIIAALFALVAVFLINRPVGEFVRVVASATVHNPEHLDMSIWDIYRSLALLGLLAVPIALQQRAASLDWLARLYDDRGAQLRQMPPQRITRRAARQPSGGGTGLARATRAR
ncbi:hypothetical protein [Mycobacteroides abscessus]|uniref:hypothetical protein n=1 Tax=Mycobacteroides abscessus TaxID=36809 RepID=UPI00041DAD81|nr:hypothetical protein [Mycobacteroides abscessus]MDO3267869.1 hypothetical protein [Mycobacteroides abscessus subsp. abscessus]